MAGKVSTLTWDAPPDGGSDITGYRVLVFEDTEQVDKLTSNEPEVDVTASETVERTAVIQAINDLGYSAPLEFPIPAASATPVDPGDGGGGTLVRPTITVTNITDTGFTMNRTVAGSGYVSYELVVLVSGAGNDGSVHVPNATFPYVVTGLTPGTEYLTGLIVTLADGSQDQSNLETFTTTGTAPATLPDGVALPTVEVVSVTADTVNYRFTASGSGYTQQQVVLLNADGAVDVHGSSAIPNVGDTASFTGLTAGTAYSLQAIIIYKDANNQDAEADGPLVSFTTTAGAATLTPPVIAGSRNGATITITETTPGAGITSSTLFRTIGGTPYAQQSPAGLPFSETDNDAHNYFVRVSNGTTSLDSNTVSIAAYTAPPAGGQTIAQGGTFQAGLIETAPQFTADGVATWSTANKTASANETAFTTQLNRARIPMWFKFYLPSSQTIRLSGLPSNPNMGFTGQDSPDNADTIAYLCAAASGNVTDADLVAGGLSEIANDDDSAGGAQPYINMTLGGGWYYILIARYQSNTTVADGRMAFRFMP